MDYQICLVDPLTKVFADEVPDAWVAAPQTVLQGEPLVLQLAYQRLRDDDASFSELTLATKLPAQCFEINQVPSQLPTWPHPDARYLRTTPGLFPDLLTPLTGPVRAYHGQVRTLWLKIPTGSLTPGRHDVTITLTETVSGQIVFAQTVPLTVASVVAQPPRLHHTEWFSVDCLADYYHEAPYTPRLWAIIANFMAFAHDEALMDTLLTPIFTPPLDTAVGATRTNVQLVQILPGMPYRFEWSRLRKWCQLAQQSGFSYLEMPPLFTQWGAQATPTITDTAGTALFGWHVPSTAPAYRAFLQALLPPLLAVLAEEGYDRDHLFFHLADEPNASTEDGYRAARAQVADLLDGLQVIDALSDVRFYENGLVPHPVVADDALAPFLAADAAPLWTYYCCAQSTAVPNRFFALRSYDNRVLGVLLYRHQIQGFLHWGFNFYNAQLSTRPIDPFAVTDAGGAFPSGDPFLVYPGADGQPLNSLRNEVQRLGFGDLAVLQQLEALKGRPFVEQLIDATAGMVPQFDDYPPDAGWLTRLHEKAVASLAAAVLAHNKK
ncbi:DUF4091 domain-containing protein [Lacticaseibacillus mingshuiensis]|uniref:DUF4091 domain-containing protein n=1 Tax=Lacticaseibacillus mingshuiensis TaxID=2799574 RepID=A0ABW4CJV3_9LACO|nr:DUF4091 domain-containing protein [Lacticaseibacillus mingshuiensis]